MLDPLFTYGITSSGMTFYQAGMPVLRIPPDRFAMLIVRLAEAMKDSSAASGYDDSG